MSNAEGPLAGTSVIEFEAIGPVPFASSLMADLGATVTRVVRPGGARSSLPGELATMGTPAGATIPIDLKDPRGVEVAHALISQSDVLIEGFRPGTLERLGIGPDVVCGASPAIIYARVTGWGQDGPYAAMAGHDINYIGLAGALHTMGPNERPMPPLNLLGDYAAGALYAVIGILAALHDVSRTGRGRVIDVAMVDGTSSLLDPIRTMQQFGLWTEERQANLLDGGAPFYRTYRTSDGGFMAVGALEPAFYEALLYGLELDSNAIPDRHDPSRWPELTEVFEKVFASRSRHEWQEVFDGTDACVTPVLSMSEVPEHPHNRARGALVEEEGRLRAGPTPRFSGESRDIRPRYAVDPIAILTAAGYSADDVAALRTDGVVG